MKTVQILIRIAWRNLWRSKVRSGVVVLAMSMGIWAGIFLSGFSIGMNEQRTDSALSTYVGYAQVHGEGWEDEPATDLLIPNLNEVENTLESTPGFVAYSSRLIQNGMVASSHGANGVVIQGVDPALDTTVYDLQTRIVDGEYLPEGSRIPKAYIGETLAEDLQLKVGSKIQLTLQDFSGYTTQVLFKVGGIFRTVSSAFDKSTIQIRKSDMTQIMGVPEGSAHEIVLKLESKEISTPYVESVRAKTSGIEVESWKEVSPELGYADDMMAFSLYIFIGIIIFAITFGILNTMLMAILERKRELGMLMAVGMNKTRVFFMIVLETLFLGFIGAPIGILIGHFTLLATGKTGFDLSAFGDGLSAYGMDAIVYPMPVPDYYVGISLMVVIMTLLSSIYPAVKALKLNPVQTMRSV